MKPLCLFVPVLLLGLVFACSDGPVDPCQDCFPQSPYPDDLFEPDSLLQQLRTSYVRREIEPYAALLARDFEFRFHPDDIDVLGEELTFEQDSLFTRNLFASPEVVDVRLAMTWGAPTDEVWEGEPMKRIVLAEVLLDVEQAGIVLRLVNQTQHLYFRPGKPALGEDPSRYYLRAWREIGAGGTGLRAAVEQTTWGSIKLRFR